MTRIVIAPDSFKGSLSAREAAQAIAAGVRAGWGAADADLVIDSFAFADGGEGTLDAVLDQWQVEPIRVKNTDAIGRPCEAQYAISADGQTALIEAAQANGLPAVSDVALRPLEATTAGVGTLALDALARGVHRIVLTLGGSATTDGGVGLLRALGARFFDAAGNTLPEGGGALQHLATVDLSGLDERALAAEWVAAVDVTNPLAGPQGAAAVFGPQKGANASDIRQLDAGLRRAAALLSADDTFGERPGLGAAGGLPLALVSVLAAELQPGAQLVAQIIGLDSSLARADLVFTGEGRLDAQSLDGKVIDYVTRTVDVGTPVIALAGSVELDAAAVRRSGLTAALSIAGGPATLDQLRDTAAQRLRETAAQAAALLRAGRGR